MSVNDFIKNPLGYSKAHVIQFTHEELPASASGMEVASTMNNWGGKWTAEQYRMIAGRFSDFTFIEAGKTNKRIGTGSKAIHTVTPTTTGADKGIRFLPWKENAVTYMSLDAGAKTFFTGPLSGCSIFIGKEQGTYWAFHANRNSSGSVANSAVKASMTVNVITRLPTTVPIVCEAIYGRDYHDFGFVFGQVSGGKWSFYCADTRLLPQGGGHAATSVRKLC